MDVFFTYGSEPCYVYQERQSNSSALCQFQSRLVQMIFGDSNILNTFIDFAGCLGLQHVGLRIQITLISGSLPKYNEGANLVKRWVRVKWIYKTRGSEHWCEWRGFIFQYEGANLVTGASRVN